jgi:hypothetical protein
LNVLLARGPIPASSTLLIAPLPTSRSSSTRPSRRRLMRSASRVLWMQMIKPRKDRHDEA